MANEEQLAILRQGVEVWNAWRLEHPAIRPNLREADLREADLREADLHNVNLYGSRLNNANLYGARLQLASLQNIYLKDYHMRHFLDQPDRIVAYTPGASLNNANLTLADLTQADLTTVDLDGANLEGANLTGVHFNDTSLQNTNLTNAEILSTTFDNLDLRNVLGLDTVRHRMPSTIGIDTLYRSQGQIPEVFLRGCGVPDSMIEYARSLVTAQRPIDYYSVFISYNNTDEAVAQRLHADLQAAGVRCWFAPHDLEIGEVITRGIDAAIRIYDKLLIILSEASVQSRWVAFEVSTALHREIEQGRTMLFPIRLDDTVLHTPSGWAAQLRTRHIGDFRGWKDHDRYQEAFTRLLRDLTAKDQAGE